VLDRGHADEELHRDQEAAGMTARWLLAPIAAVFLYEAIYYGAAITCVYTFGWSCAYFFMLPQLPGLP
jgi:hypothetical protein